MTCDGSGRLPDISPPAAHSLLFRLPRPEDAGALQPILDDPTVRKAMNWVGQHTDAGPWITVQLAMHEARGPFQGTSEFYPFVIVRPADNVLIGIAQVNIAFENRTILTGEFRSLFFSAAHRNRRHGREALSALIRWAFEDVIVEGYGQSGTLRQVLAVCNPDNTAASQLLRRHLKDDGIVDSNPDERGEVRRVHQFRLTRDQYNDPEYPR
jgi:RimJ/RimL family protein N-acetyltransferase